MAKSNWTPMKHEAGGGSGGGGAFAPKPGGGYKVPPIPPGGLANPPMGMPKGMKFPQRNRGGWRPSKGLLGEIGAKAKAFQRFKEWAENFLWPDSPSQMPAGWQIPAGWTQCPTPDCAGSAGAPDFGIWASTTICTGFAPCPPGQAGGVWNTTRRNWGDPHPTREKVLGYKWTSGLHTDGSFRGTIVVQFTRPDGSVTDMPVWQVGRIILPDEFAEPFPDAVARELTYGQPKPKADPRSPAWAFTDLKPRVGVPPWAKPGVDIGPETGGATAPPVVPHLPLPPKKPDKEDKPFPNGIPYGAFGKWYGRVTEFNDMLDCLAESMGQPNPTGPSQERARKVWGMMQENPPDPGAFAMCMARENFQDLVIGKLNKAATRAMNRSPYASPRPGGYRGGGWGSRMHNSGG